MKDRFSVVIVGAGIHGTTLSAALREADPSLSMAVIDPRSFCEHWRSITAKMGMTSMRSPWNHYVGGYSAPKSMRGFALDRGHTASLRIDPPLSVFNAHATDIIVSSGLDKYRIPAQVVRIEPTYRGYTLDLKHEGGDVDRIRTRNVILATGLGQPFIPHIPGANNPLVTHSSEVAIRTPEWRRPQRILVVGGGLTAATLAVRLAETGSRVTLAIRSEKLVQPFDFDPKWFDGSLYWRFRDLRSLQDRAAMLKDIRGSITPNFNREMFLLRNKIRVLEHAPVTRISQSSTSLRKNVIEAWSNERMLGAFDRAILATGYTTSILDLPFLEPIWQDIELIEGFPILDDQLRMRRGLFVTGALARYGIGAAAPNVFGADLAADKIVSAIVHRMW